MNAIDLLLRRTSQPLLTAPAPNEEDLDFFLKAASRAPDHAQLKPWRFLTIRDEGLGQLGDLFVNAAETAGESSQEKLEKLRKKPLRAPMIMVAIASLQEHEKVPEPEQFLAAGCATHAMLYAAQARGFGAMWRTGTMAYDPVVGKGLGLTENEHIIGYLYIGTPKVLREVPQDSNYSDYCSEWTGEL